MKKYLILTLFLFFNFTMQLFAQAYEEGQLYVYVLNSSDIPTFEKDGESIKILCNNQALQGVLSQYEVYSFEKAFPIVDNFTQTEKYDLNRVYLLQCNGDEESLMSELNNNYFQSYDYVEMVPHYFLLNTPNDYHLLDGSLGSNYALDIINAKDAWDITTGSTSTKVGIIDTGFDLTNPELIGKIDNVINNTQDNTHGTFVAGIVAANTNNNLGISSIGYNCHLSVTSYGWSGPIGYILALSNQGIKAINISVGSCGFSRAENDIVNLAFDNGTLVIASAGNGINEYGNCSLASCGSDCNGYLYPASFDRVLSVTSVGPNLSHVSSNGAIHTHNDKVDVCAAGYDVISIGRDYGGNFACFKSSGTSFAAPYVSGLAGLIYSINPNFTPEQVYHIIKSTTQNIDAQNPQYIGLIGTGLIDAEAAVLMAQDIANDPGNNYNVYNGQNLLWDENDVKVVNSYIHIYPGGTLTIKGDVYLKSNAVITVERGASLYLDGAYITKHGTQNWEGIEVWGNYTLDQIPTSNQGYLKVYNNSTISSANRAIKVGKGSGDLLLYNYGGGIIHVENSTLVNNNKSVIFSPYRRYSPPLELHNKSYIRNCDLTWDKANIEGMVFITLYDVNINDLSGNRFQNNMGNNAVLSEKNGIGILSSHSTFSVKSLSVSGIVKDSYFYNLYYGVKSDVYNPVQTFQVENAYFNKVFNGIYANGSNNLRILNNTFKPLNYPDIPQYFPVCYGLYMNGCSGYTVQNNIFQNFENSSQIRKIIGIVVNNSGSAYNLINDNSFSNLKVGVLAQNQNRGSLVAYTGLFIKCNYFTHNKNDIAVTGDQNTAGYGIGYYQGTNTTISSPAGNLFGHAFQGTTSDYHNELQNIIYVHHSPSQDYPELIPWYYTSSTITLLDSQQTYWPGLSCTFVVPVEKEELKSFVEEKEGSINALKANLSELIDQGSTVTLENTVILSTPEESYEVYQDLMQTGSYVSNAVLSAAVEKEDVLNDAMIRDVLVANPHAAKDPNVMNLVENRVTPLPNYMLDQVENGLNILSAKEQMELQISILGLESKIAERELIYQYKNDTINPIVSHDSLFTFLGNRNRFDANIDLAYEYLQKNEISTALNVVNSINATDLGPEELNLRNKMIEYLQFHNSLNLGERTIWDLNQNDISKLEILSIGDDLVANCARSILVSNAQMQYTEPILLPDDSYKSSRIERRKELILDRYLKLYPNPATKWVTIEFSIIKTTSERTILEISDMTGRTIRTIELQDKTNKVVVDLRNLHSGVYLCTLKSGNSIFASQKLTVQ